MIVFAFCTQIQELAPEIKEFKEYVAKKESSSLLVIISSHGYYNGICMSDGEFKDLWIDFVYPFREEAFKSFKSKAKIFVVNACLKFSKSSESERKAKFGGSTQDIIVLYSCMPGYLSYRNWRNGSWFIYYFIQSIFENKSKHNNKHHLVEIMRDVHTKQARHGKKFQCGTNMDCLFNKFYF